MPRNYKRAQNGVWRSTTESVVKREGEWSESSAVKKEGFDWRLIVSYWLRAIVKEGVHKPNHPIQNPLLLVKEPQTCNNIQCLILLALAQTEESDASYSKSGRPHKILLTFALLRKLNCRIEPLSHNDYTRSTYLNITKLCVSPTRAYLHVSYDSCNKQRKVVPVLN
jgi:hypothetical protein